MDRGELAALRDAIDLLLKCPDRVRAELVRWFAPEAAKPNGRDHDPPLAKAMIWCSHIRIAASDCWQNGVRNTVLKAFRDQFRSSKRLAPATGPAPDTPSEEDSEMTERISLEGKVAVVTGAGRGLGRAYVELLAERGARVVVNDLGTDVSGFGKDSTIAQQVADLIRSRGGAAIANESDISTAEGGSDLIATTIEHFGRIDLLVNNAGICGSQLFEHATLDDFDHYWRVHLGGPVNTVKAAWPHMVAQRYGKIILTTSVAGLFGIRGQATYAAAKCAVVGLMRILAMEGAEHGILVNTISPNGYTRMHPAAGSRMPERDGKATMPVEAVAPAIVWLASDGCAETNSIYNLEGGTIQRIAIVMGPGFYDPHLTPESIAANYAKVVSIEGFSEPGPFELSS
jgi:NAD(P)-dependent dehydrogenase (short-subunit alcohol dehydrogenase family)